MLLSAIGRRPLIVIYYNNNLMTQSSKSDVRDDGDGAIRFEANI